MKNDDFRGRKKFLKNLKKPLDKLKISAII